MGTRFSLLFATAFEDRAAALAATLARAGLEPAYTVVDNIHDLSMALAEEPWDAVASDQDVPGLPWRETMALARAAREDVPFVLMAPGLEPAAARAAVREGADDVLAEADWRAPAVFTRLLRDAARRRRLARQWERLHADEGTYRGMIENSVLGIFQCTPWGALVTFNPSFARILGHDGAEALGRHLAGADRKLPLADERALEALLFMVREREFVSDFETRVLRRDGALAWVSITARAMRGEAGEVAGIEGTIEDIGKRKAVEDMIIRAKQEWEKTFDSVPDIIAILGEDLTVRRLNMALAARLGAHPKDMVGRPCEAVFDPGDGPPLAGPRIRRMVREAGQPEEMHIPALGGWFLVTVSPFDLGEGARGGFVLTAHDVSRRKELEARLRQSQKLEAIGTLAGGIAHDFNNILGVIMGYTEMSLEEPDLPAPARRRLAEVLTAGRRARDLIHQILTFSRQEEPDLRPLALDSVVKEAVKLLRASIPANVDIALDLAGPGTVRANLSQVHQVLMNLCTNAAHAMREGGGRLSIALERVELDALGAAQHPPLAPGPHVRLTVADTGHGIPEAIRDKVFDPFFTTKGPDEGTGMGLAMVHGIVTGHGGAVSVRSAPGQGAAFEILLPEAPGAPDALAEAGPDHVAPRGGRVLLVDDEAPLAAVLGEMLRSLGLHAHIETDSARALELLRADPGAFDLLVTDQTMPGLTGTGLAREARALRPELPVILCTGFCREPAAGAARELGIAVTLHKPVQKADLARAVRAALGRAGG
ncbi:PAS domain-containing hybrid sensor histidine kinase/response regulator [Desulfocurvus vexinensis]|uniref:PAS domain-containing hybrid sensor histidine kinase/response regulator n=1 Tax=Desulfocurvus vexinensis TaxID=399548 RepID=UPI0004B972CE|nr:PAS domain-containing sensor histidine kinase [Desulfocurvus vexinensis]